MKRAAKKEKKKANNEYPCYLGSRNWKKEARQKAIDESNTPKMPGPARIPPSGSFDRIFGRSRHLSGNLTESDSFGTMHTQEDTPPGMCPCFADGSRVQVKTRNVSVWPDDKFNVRRRKMECPFCKRRVIARVSFGHDGDCMFFMMPVHKPKHWWKRKKKRPMRDKICRRQRGR